MKLAAPRGISVSEASELAKKVEEELPFGVEVMNFASIDLRENVFLIDAPDRSRTIGI
jgi:hypothetical protein